MKKYIFISFLLLLIIIVVLIFNQNKVDIKPKTYKSDLVEVNYPLFNNTKIDNYIWDYLNEKITNEKNLFIDYDYLINKSNISLTFYTYSKEGNVLKTSKKDLVIDTKKSKISVEDKKKIEDNNLIDNINKRSTKLIALTFDDGPSYNTSRLIDILNKYNAKATFFVVGSRLKDNAKVLKKIKDSGMEIGNHTYSHKLLTKLSEDKINEEFSKTDNLVYEFTGKKPSIVRPSYGSVNKRIKKLADRPIIIWDIDTLDWKHHNSSYISNNVLNKAKDGDIVLMHDIYTATVNAVELLVPKLMNEGYQLVTVSELFYYKNITLEKGNVYGSAHK